MEISGGMDGTYVILDWNQRKISFGEFNALDVDSQDECTIIRPDGTLLTYEDYYTDKLASDTHGYKGDMY